MVPLMRTTPCFCIQCAGLYKGVGKKGGVIEYPLAQMTLQLLIHKDRFPEGFGASSQKLAAQAFDKGRATAKKNQRFHLPLVSIPDADKTTTKCSLMFRRVARQA